MSANSPFRRHQRMVRGAASGPAADQSAGKRETMVDRRSGPGPANGLPAPEGQEYAGLRVLLDDNLRALGDIQSHEARHPKKAEFAAEFKPWIEGVLAAGESGATAAQDDVLVTNMIWAVDYRDIDYALRLGQHAIAHNLILPGSYTRSVPVFLAEDIAQLSLSEQDKVSHEQLLRLAGMVDGRDMPDPVLARLHKAIGRSFEREAEAFDPAADNAPAGGKAAFATESLTHLQRALSLDKQAGVKKDIERLQRQLKELAKETGEPQAGTA